MSHCEILGCEPGYLAWGTINTRNSGDIINTHALWFFFYLPNHIISVVAIWVFVLSTDHHGTQMADIHYCAKSPTDHLIRSAFLKLTERWFFWLPPFVDWSIGPLVHWSIGPLVHWLNVNCQMSKINKVKCQMSKINKVNFDGAYLRSSSGHFYHLHSHQQINCIFAIHHITKQFWTKPRFSSSYNS